MPVYDADQIPAWHPHTLIVSVRAPEGEKWTSEKLLEVKEACVSTFHEQFSTIEFLWGSFFDDWAIDLISEELTTGLISESPGDRHILGKRYLARFVLPPALFPAAPNPRGNQSGSIHPVEGRIQDVI